MPFVHRRANRVLLLHSLRAEGQVRQLTLHTFYDAEELALVLADEAWAPWTRTMEWQHPDLRWKWMDIRERLDEELTTWRVEAVLPEPAHLADLARRLLTALPPDCAPLGKELASSLDALRQRLNHLLADEQVDTPTTLEETMPILTLDADGLDPADRLYFAAMEHWYKGDRATGLRVLRDVLALDPRHADANTHFGAQALEDGHLKLAEQHFKTAIEGGSRSLQVDGGLISWGYTQNRPFLRAHAMMAQLHRRRGEWAKAARVHEQLLQYNPNDNQGIRFLVGQDHHHLGNLERAVTCYHRAIEDLDPGSCFSLALALHQLGRHDEVPLALLKGFGGNRYIATKLLGLELGNLDAVYLVSTEWEAYADEYLEQMADLWRSTPSAREPLHDWWMAPHVRAWRAAIDDLAVRSKGVPPSDKRSELVAAQRALKSNDRLAELAAISPEEARSDPPTLSWLRVPVAEPERLATGDTWITDVRHMAPPGAKTTPEALRLHAYFGRIVRAATSWPTDLPLETAICCRRRPKRRPCPGHILLITDELEMRIRWECTRCNDNGVFRHWEETWWDLGGESGEDLEEWRDVTITQDDHAVLLLVDERLRGAAARVAGRAEHRPGSVVLAGVPAALREVADQVRGLTDYVWEERQRDALRRVGRRIDIVIGGSERER